MKNACVLSAILKKNEKIHQPWLITNLKSCQPSWSLIKHSIRLPAHPASYGSFACVIHSIFHKSLNNPDIYKGIALFLSLLISIGMCAGKERNSTRMVTVVDQWVLIFIYARFNSISVIFGSTPINSRCIYHCRASIGISIFRYHKSGHFWFLWK